ncbi:MAG TPA: hypothetical protein PLM53_05580 [Spirochaetota bacterium]|nr:hypothetical protein [Spirochaetota bacterium]HPC40502.1 hypothetical protein [Spirochaetota bacterium]HPL17436.1 hypothetical protein [Spirochaetota bacterium]HQF07990.1 hypothetical protein [Spirochaetota bacterium]HQH96550.1 hypothetical protein [Spirochaetota bacterium]
MTQKLIHSILAISAALPILFIAGPSDLLAAGITDDGGMETAQYIEDRETGRDNRYKKGTVLDYKNRELARTVPRFIMGLSGGLDAREGYGSASLSAPLGVLYDRFTMTFDIGVVYSNAKSLRKNKSDLMDSLVRTRMSGHIVEFNLPFKFSYSVLDLEKNTYTPYLTAGIGYGYRKFFLRASSSIDRTVREYSINSFTMHYGFGFLVRTSEDTRFNAGLTGISHFSNKTGEFNYDTTGVSIGLGLLLIF